MGGFGVWGGGGVVLGVQHSLVVGVRVGAGAGLAVLGGPDGGVPEESLGALLTELALGAVKTALDHTNKQTNKQTKAALPSWTSCLSL